MLHHKSGWPEPAAAPDHALMEDQPHSLQHLAAKDAPVRIGFFMIEDYPLMTFSAALDPLRQGNRLAGRQAFEWTLISAKGGVVQSSSGLGFPVDHVMLEAPKCDVVILCAGVNYANGFDPAIFSWLRRLHREGCV
ncbi:MAG: hypothetical protein JO234_04660, partial [Hyphomicrobiales bacterium]|nr:hypothetical protein [Hyphomicrobiales bacterium]